MADLDKVLANIKNKNSKAFLSLVLSEAAEKNINLKFYNINKKLDKNFDILGYFDEENIAIKKDKLWLETLVHEYSHFIQWRDKHPSYTAYKKSYDPIDTVEKWLIKPTLEYTNVVKKSFNIIRKNEIECDILAGKLIEKYELPINLKLYAQRSNRQILFYHCIEITRNDKPSQEFYSHRFLKDFPETFQKSFATKIPDDLITKATKYFVSA